MKTPINETNQYKKGELFLNKMGWAGIVMEATRGNNPTIIPMTEIFGFEHECGSIYTNEIERRISIAEFRSIAGGKGDIYFKGKILDLIK